MSPVLRHCSLCLLAEEQESYNGGYEWSNLLHMSLSTKTRGTTDSNHHPDELNTQKLNVFSICPTFPLAPKRILTGTKKMFSIPLRSHFPKLHLRVWIEGPAHVLLVSSHDLPLCCVPLPHVTVHCVHSDHGDQPSSLSIAWPQYRHKAIFFKLY